MLAKSSSSAELRADVVLTKATLRAADKLAVTHQRLAQVLGVSPASASRLGKSRTIDPGCKEGELAILFVRLFRSLDALLGGNEEAARRWFWAANDHLHGVPAERVTSVTGLLGVVEYVDAMRGRL